MYNGLVIHECEAAHIIKEHLFGRSYTESSLSDSILYELPQLLINLEATKHCYGMQDQ